MKDKGIIISLGQKTTGMDGSYKEELVIDLRRVNNYEALGMLRMAMLNIEFVIDKELNGEQN